MGNCDLIEAGDILCSMIHKNVVVITRTQNRPLFLARAIESVQSQTYESIEHLIYNDGAARNTVDDVIQKVKTANKSVKMTVLHNKISRGMEAASNDAIRTSNSKYIAIHDDDDTWHPDMLKHAIVHLEETNAMGVVVRANKIIEEVSSGGMIESKKVQHWMPEMKAVNLYKQCIDNQMTPITFVYRREAFEELSGYDESLPVCGDWDFGIRFLQKWDVEYLDPGFALASYHHRKFRSGQEGNTSFSGNERHRYYANKLMNRYLREELREGRLGVGYIMSQLRYNESRIAQYVKKILPKGIVDRVKNTVQN